MLLPSVQFSHILTITAAFLAILAGRQYFRYNTPPTIWAGWFMIFMAIELIVFSYQLITGPFETIPISYFVQSAFFVLLSICWLFFISSIADQPAKMNRWLVIFLLVLTAIIFFLITAGHSNTGRVFIPGATLAMSVFHLGDVIGFSGTWILAFLYAEGIVFLILLYRLSKNADKFRRVFALPMLIGTLGFYVLAILEHTGVDPFVPFHLTQIGLVAASIVVFLFAVVWRFGGFLPISRESVFDDLRDGVLILNYADNVIDLNPVARKLLGVSQNEIIGKPLHEVWPDAARMIARNPDEALIDSECSMTIEGQEYTFAVNINRSLGLNQSLLGSVIVMRNVTSLDRMEEVLQERNAELQRSNTYLEALAEVNRNMHEATEIANMNSIIGEELKKLGLVCFLARFDELSGDLTITYYSGRVEGVRAVEKLIGEQVVGFPLEKEQFAMLYQLIDENQVFYDIFDHDSMQTVPGKIPSTLLEKAASVVGLGINVSALLLPLYTSNHKLGLMGVWGNDLREEDIPPFKIFANQVANVMERVIQHNNEVRHAAELKRVNDLTTALSHVASAIGSTSDYGLVFDALAQELKKAGLYCAIANIDTDTETAYLNYLSITPGLQRLFEKMSGINLKNFEIPSKFWPGKKLLLEQKPSWYSNPQEVLGRMFPDVPEKMRDRAFVLMKIKADEELCFLPLVFQNDTIGVLVLWGPALRVEDYPILSVFGSQLSGILNKINRYEEQLQRSDELLRVNAIILALSKVAMKLDTLSKLEDVYKALGEELRSLGISCMVGILDKEKQNLMVEHVSLKPGVIQFANGLGIVWPEKPNIPRQLWPSVQVVENGIPFWDDDPVGSAKRMFPFVPRIVFERAYQFSSVANNGQICYIPMINREEIFGVLSLWGQGLQKEDVPALTVFANQLASAINNINLYEQAQREIEERRQAESRIREALEDKEVLLKEVHHRVKNNLQIISSLLNLQLTQTEDELTEDILRESQNRVRSMALIHEKLYQSKDLARVDFDAYLQSLIASLRQTYRVNPEKVQIDVRSENLLLSIDTAIPCGMIVNELVSNSLKYAFEETHMGKIDVVCNEMGHGRYSLIVQDNGGGLPEGFQPELSTTLGLKLVNSLVRQIDGDVQVDNQRGTRFEIEFVEMDSA